jgi:hypothetical protein
LVQRSAKPLSIASKSTRPFPQTQPSAAECTSESGVVVEKQPVQSSEPVAAATAVTDTGSRPFVSLVVAASGGGLVTVYTALLETRGRERERERGGEREAQVPTGPRCAYGRQVRSRCVRTGRTKREREAEAETA